jgi:hypothetical protein
MLRPWLRPASAIPAEASPSPVLDARSRRSAFGCSRTDLSAYIAPRANRPYGAVQAQLDLRDVVL